MSKDTKRFIISIALAIVMVGIYMIPGGVWQGIGCNPDTGKTIATIGTGFWIGCSLVVAVVELWRIWRQ